MKKLIVNSVIIFSFLVCSFILPVQSFALISDNSSASEKTGALFFNPSQKSGEISTRFLKSTGGERILISTGPDANFNQALPKAISENYQEAKFDGYIVELKQLSLAEKKKQLEEALKAKIAPLESSLSKAGTQAEREYYKKIIGLTTQVENVKNKIALLDHNTLISNEQNQAASVIKKIAPTAKIDRKFIKVFDGFVIKNISAKEIQNLREKGYKLRPNYKVEASLMDSVPLINADDVWRMKDASGTPVTGTGIEIGIIDTGVDYTHSDLGGCLGTNCKVMGGYDFVNNDSDPMDDNGHGTHVASIAAGNGTLKGVAPDAKIYAFKVLDNTGSGWSDDIIAAIERTADPNQDNDFSDHLDAINLSLGGGGDPDDPMSQAIDNVVGLGVVAAVAAGNSGPGLQTIGSPGTARKAITVAASDKQDKIAYFSSRGPVIWNNQSIVKPDITAPGVSICAAEWDNWSSESRCLDDKHIAISGTSMATPHVTGAVALIKQLHPDWEPLQIKYSLRNTALDIGYSSIDQGTGRVDVLKAAQLSGEPLIAQLDPISTGKTGSINITGYLSNISNFKSYTLSYAQLYSNSFTLLKTSTLPESGTLYQLNLNQIPDGKYILKLTIENTTGQQAIDYGYFEVEKWQITNPLDLDILRAGDSIPLEVKVSPGLTNYVLNWYYIGPNSSTWLPIQDNKWNTAGLTTGIYNLKAILNYGGLAEEKILQVFLDSTLKQGWPKRINWENLECPWGEGDCYYWGGYLEPVVSDINNDGYQEVVVFKGGKPPKLLAYNYNGTLLWSVNVGTQEAAGGNLSIPLVADVNNDGQKEIFAINPCVGKGDSSWSEIYTFQSNGLPFSSWHQPVKIPPMGRGYMLIADLNLDGKNEIVIKSSFTQQKVMVVLNSKGEIISQWPLLFNPTTSWSASIESYPAIGNFDNDKELEIVVADLSENVGYDLTTNSYTNEGIIYIFNMDGSSVPGWPIRTKGIIFSSPAVGDVNKDGKDEIVVGLMYSSDIFPEPELGGIYVFDRNGNILPGWPQLKSYNFWSSPSLADIDGGGDLEIGASYLGFETYFFHHDGTLVSGWPQNTSWQDYYSTIIGDADGDKKPDLLTTAGDYWYGEGGVYAWKDNGQTMTGFPKATEVDAQAPAVIADIDKDGKVEVIASSDWDSLNVEFKFRGSVYVWDLPANFNKETMPWPTFHHDEQRTGLYEVSTSTQATTTRYVNLNASSTVDKNSSFPVSWSSDSTEKKCRLYFACGNQTIQNLNSNASSTLTASCDPGSYELAIRCFNEKELSGYGDDTTKIPTTLGIRSEQKIEVAVIKSITVLSPNGGESWTLNTRTDSDTCSILHCEEIKWSGGSGSDYRAVTAYLEQYTNGQFVTIGKIPAYAYGSISWPVGIIVPTSCPVDTYSNLDSCARSLVKPGQYYVRLVDKTTGVTDRSDAAFSIVATPTGELRGKILKDDNGNGIQDSGEVYLRDPTLSGCPNPSYLQSDILINYTGPASGSTSLNQCSTVTGDPIYSVSNLTTGNYTVSVTVPVGWQATAARVDNPLNAPCTSLTSCSNVPINSGSATVVVFSMRPTMTHCERCSVNSSYQWVSFDSTDSTCATVLPSGNPVTRTCNCSCPGNVGNLYPPNCRAQCESELRGKILKDDNGNGVADAGEVYLRGPSCPDCPNSSYLQSGITINYSGPTSGSTLLNQCSTITGDPIYSLPNLPIGNYTVSVTVPAGWETTAARVDNPLNAPCTSLTSCSNVPINSGAATVVIFSMRPAPTYHCSRCSVIWDRMWVEFNTTDSTCATVVPTSNPVTQTLNCTCSAGDASWYNSNYPGVCQLSTHCSRCSYRLDYLWVEFEGQSGTACELVLPGTTVLGTCNCNCNAASSPYAAKYYQGPDPTCQAVCSQYPRYSSVPPQPTTPVTSENKESKMANIQNQLASIAEAISQLMEGMKELMAR